MRRRFFAPALLFTALAFSASAAFAHSTLVESAPAVDSVVSASGFPIELRFNGRVDAARSRLLLTLADGTSRKLETKPGAGPSSVSAQSGSVPAGRCTLRYDVLSNDGHLTTGTIAFTAAER